MKTAHILTLALWLLCSTVMAEARDQLPDLSKALPGGKFLDQADPELMVGYQYEYTSDSDFEALKSKLKEFLGERWKEKKVNPTMTKVLRKVMKAESIDLVGQATFSNPDFPTEGITLTMKNEKFDGKERRIVTIYGTWHKKPD